VSFGTWAGKDLSRAALQTGSRVAALIALPFIGVEIQAEGRVGPNPRIGREMRRQAGRLPVSATWVFSLGHVQAHLAAQESTPVEGSHDGSPVWRR